MSLLYKSQSAAVTDAQKLVMPHYRVWRKCHCLKTVLYDNKGRQKTFNRIILFSWKHFVWKCCIDFSILAYISEHISRMGLVMKFSCLHFLFYILNLIFQHLHESWYLSASFDCSDIVSLKLKVGWKEFAVAFCGTLRQNRHDLGKC